MSAPRTTIRRTLERQWTALHREIGAHQCRPQPQQRRCLSTKRPSMLRRQRDELTVQPMKVPSYLVPEAYRADKEGGNNRSGGGRNKRGPNGPHARRSRANGASPSRHRRKAFRLPGAAGEKASLGQRGNNRRTFQSSKARERQALTIDQLRQLEEALSRKTNDYLRTLSGASLSDLDNLDGHLRETVPLARDLHATEQSYDDMASDYTTLVTGWAELAESICARKRTETSFLANEGYQGVVDKSTAATVAEYEDAAARAERHLESFEALARNRANVRSKEEVRGADEATSEGGNKRGILSFFENFFEASPGGEATETEAAGAQSEAKEEEASTKGAAATIDASLYERVLLANHAAYCFGREAKEDATQRSNRLLNRWISLYGMSTSENVVDATTNENSDALKDGADSLERKLFHIVIRQNVDLWTKEGVERAEDWLGRMRHLQKLGRTECAPDVEAHNLVLLGFTHLCKRFWNARPSRIHSTGRTGLAEEERVLHDREEEGDVRRFALEGAERVLSEMSGDEGGGAKPNVVSLNLALHALAKAGRKVDTTCQKANSLVFDVVGEEAYREMMGSGGGSSRIRAETAHVEPTLDTYHWIVDIYSASGNQVHIQQAVALLRKMINLRREEEEEANQSSKGNASFAPSTGTHNSVLRALAEKIEEVPFNSRTKTAKAATEVLDTMVQYESSLPTPNTFVLLLQMWQKSKLPQAGEYAEEILARMEVAATHNEDLEAFSYAYGLALGCWLTSAMAGTAGAAERAYRLLEVMEARAGRAPDDSLPSHRHFLILKICAATKHKEDLPQAVNVAFEVYDKMVENGVKPNARTFEYMYMCVRNYCDQYPEEEQSGLLQRVFEPASQHGITRRELMGRHKQSLRKGYLVA
ncbi:hypothetical protein ACHAXT_004218 [Thalassiosira profunda]